MGRRRGPRATAAGGPPKLACPDARSQGGGGRRAKKRRRDSCATSAAAAAPRRPRPPTGEIDQHSLVGGGHKRATCRQWGMRMDQAPSPRTPPPSSTAVFRLGLPARLWPTRLRGRPAGAQARKATRLAGLSPGLKSTVRQGSATGGRDPPHHLPLATLLPEPVLQESYSHPPQQATERLQTMPSRPKRRRGEREAGARGGLAATAHSGKLTPGGRHRARHAPALTPHSGTPDGWAAGRRERRGSQPHHPGARTR